MVNRLETITLECNECKNSSLINYETFASKLPNSEKVNFKNLNQLIDFFVCKACNKKNFVIFDHHKEIIFDLSNIISCEECENPIPIPRINANPNKRICIICAEIDEGDRHKPDQGTKTPKIPLEAPKFCPSCEKYGRKSIIVIYQNRKDKNFFLGCSKFPKCRWSTNKYYDDLNIKNNFT